MIPAHNAAATIARAVRSARSSLQASVIVVDDGSHDATAEIAAAAGAAVIRQANMGASHARLVGLAQAASDFVVFLDSDDALRPETQIALNALRSSSSAAVVGGGFLRSGAKRNALTRPLRSSETTSSLLAAFGAPWPASASIWRRSALLVAEAHPVQAVRPRFAEDFELLIRASLVGDVLAVQAVVANYSMGGGKSTRNAFAAVSDSEKLRRYYAAALGLPLEERSTRMLRQAAVWRTAMSAYYEGGALGLLSRLVASPRDVPPLINAAGQRVRERRPLAAKVADAP